MIDGNSIEHGYSRAFELQWQLLKIFEQRRKKAMKEDSSFTDQDGFDARRYSSLEGGQVYYFSKEISNFIMSSAASVPNVVLEDSDIPNESAFWYFSEPLRIPNSYIGPIRAIGWACAYKFPDSDQTYMIFMDKTPPANSCFLWVTFYQEDYSLSSLPVPATQIPWFFGQSLEKTIEEGKITIPIGEGIRPIKLKYFVAALMFIKQKLFNHQQIPVDRVTRQRTVGRKAVVPHINVYFLRKTYSKNNQTTPSKINWACRWSVRGHWRQQMTGPGRTQPRIAWVSPYIKGPVDKEIKLPSKTLFAVVR